MRLVCATLARLLLISKFEISICFLEFAYTPTVFIDGHINRLPWLDTKRCEDWILHVAAHLSSYIGLVTTVHNWKF